MRKTERRVIIMGAAGRDFHNFNVAFRDDDRYRVVAFTAAQIPNIEGRQYPPELAGDLYPEGIPIFPESDLRELIRTRQVDQVVFAYSDLSHADVMHKASIVLSAGADFWLLGPESTMVRSCKPVISICAVRTGAGKSQTTRRVCDLTIERGLRVVVIRHPMPYGDLAKQAVQRFAVMADLDKHHCTIEEREEYEPHIVRGTVVYAGVDYEAILRQAEQEADVVIWDGGNNDLPFYSSDLHIVVADPHRSGHELAYHPGEANFRMADVIVVNKVDSAQPADIEAVMANARVVNPQAILIRARSEIKVTNGSSIKGRRVLVIEDGPTLTHGGMKYGAGVVAARRLGAAEIVDPRPYAVGSIAETFQTYPDTGPLLPAMGYGERQIQDLEATIEATPCDIVVVGTPIDLGKLVQSSTPMVRLTYELVEEGEPTIKTVLDQKLPDILRNAESP